MIAGALAPPALLRRWNDRGAPLEPQYGGTEMGPMAFVLDRSRQDKAEAGAAGRRAFHTEVRLVDAVGNDVPAGSVGEIWLRGPSITTGYWGKNPEDFFTPDGWFRTGDAARRDDEGFYYLAGRTKEMYKSGGENVYPAEVENVLAAHPSVADLAVVAIPDPRWDEVGCAVAVLRNGTSLTLPELNDFGREKLAKFKLPKRLVIVDQLPRNVTGKINRSAVRESCAFLTA